MPINLPYQMQPTRGQRVCNTPPRSRLWPGHNTIKTITVGGVYADGTHSYTIDGVLVSVTVAGTNFAGVAVALKAKHDSVVLANDEAEASVSGAVGKLNSRTPETTFVLANLTAPGGATLTQADLTQTSNPPRLRPGLAVALNNTNPAWVRRLTAGDTGASVFGIVQEGRDMAEIHGAFLGHLQSAGCRQLSMRRARDW